MADRLSDPESRFYTSMVTNVAELIDILPQLNVNGDADLNRVAAEVQQRRCNHSAHELKKHDLLRVTTATDALDLVTQMDRILQTRERKTGNEIVNETNADSIVTQMSAYMEYPRAA